MSAFEDWWVTQRTGDYYPNDYPQDFARAAWNAAVEACAVTVENHEEDNHDTGTCVFMMREIRKLKAGEE